MVVWAKIKGLRLFKILFPQVTVILPAGQRSRCSSAAAPPPEKNQVLGENIKQQCNEKKQRRSSHFATFNKQLLVDTTMDDPTLAIMSHGSPSKIQSITFLDLSEDLIFGIAFSGYLGFTVKSIVKILLTCRQLYRIGRYQVGIFQFHDQFTQHQWCTISKALGQFDSVSCMDFSYSHSERLPSSILKNLTRWSTTLFGLNFKDTLISDADLKFLTSFDDFEMIHEDQTNEESLKNHSISASSSLTTLESLDVTMDLETDEAISCSSRETQKIIVSQVQYPQLRFLDLSKVKRIDRTLITDEALTPFLRCNQMKWLNLGMTDITNAGIEKIVKAMPHLEYLSIPYCHRLTDHCLYHIKQLPLVVLDITFCRGLTLNAFTILFGDR